MEKEEDYGGGGKDKQGERQEEEGKEGKEGGVGRQGMEVEGEEEKKVTNGEEKGMKRDWRMGKEKEEEKEEEED